MTNKAGFIAHVEELLKPLGGVRAKRMFGGYGIYKNGKMFALISDDQLFFKETEKNKMDIKERGLKPFTYQRKGKEVALSYYEAPAECLDESRVMVEWAGLAL